MTDETRLRTLVMRRDLYWVLEVDVVLTSPPTKGRRPKTLSSPGPDGSVLDCLESMDDEYV